jgi:hypothetical protein
MANLKQYVPETMDLLVVFSSKVTNVEMDEGYLTIYFENGFFLTFSSEETAEVINPIVIFPKER